MPPAGFKAPLHLALVVLEHNAIVLCHALNESDAMIKIGDRVQVTTGEKELLYYTKIRPL